MKIINKECISILNHASSWEDAIKQAGTLLLNVGAIDSNYISQMIKSVNDLGPYIVLTPGFALAHAAPSESVKTTSLSVITLDKPVDFGGNKGGVDVVMCLACTSEDSHMSMIQQVAQLLLIPGILQQIRNVKSVDELYTLLNTSA